MKYMKIKFICCLAFLKVATRKFQNQTYGSCYISIGQQALVSRPLACSFWLKSHPPRYCRPHSPSLFQFIQGSMPVSSFQEHSPQCKRSPFSSCQISGLILFCIIHTCLSYSQQPVSPWRPYFLVCVFTVCLPQLECKPVGAGSLMVSFTLMCMFVLSCIDFL